MIAQIENAIIAKLRAAEDFVGYKLKTVEAYGGQLGEPEELKKIANVLPGAFVVFMAERVKRQAAPEAWIMEAKFAVFCATINRVDTAKRHGDAKDPGSYRIFEDVQRLIAGQDFGLTIAPLAPNQVRPLFSGRVAAGLLSIISVEFLTEFVLSAEFTAVPDPDVCPELSGLNVSWDLADPNPANDQSGPDGVENARDIINLEGK